MQPLSQEHRDSFLKKKSYALSLFDENTTVEEILKKIYIENMESKSEMQAEVMAQNVIETIDMIFSTRDSLQNEPGEIIDKLNAALGDFSAEEKAKKLLSASYVFENIETLVKKGKLDTEPLRPMLNDLKKQTVDDDYLYVLLNRTVSAVKNDKTSGTLLKAIPEYKKEEEYGFLLKNEKCDRKTLIAVDSMILYIMAVNGELGSVDKKISLFEVTAGVCLGDTLDKIAIRARKGTITGEKIKENIGFILFSILISAVVSFVVFGVFGLEEFLIGLLCVALYSCMLIIFSHCLFNNGVALGKLEIPMVKFAEISSEFRDDIKEKIKSAKLTSIRKTINNILSNDNQYDNQNQPQSLRVDFGDPDSPLL